MNPIIKVRRSYAASTPPTAGQLAEGQLAVNITDKKIYIGDNVGGVVDITSSAGSYFAGAGLTLSSNTFSITDTAVSPASYGDATHVGAFTVNSRGQITAASAIAITFPVVSVFGQTGAVGNLSGDVTTSGSSATTLAASGVTAGTYTKVTVDAKGRVTVGANPTTLAGYGITDALPLAGGSMTGSITMTSGSTITGIPTPTNSSDVANKAYVDAAASGFNIHTECNVATTSNLVATYNNGTAGVGATLTNNGTQVVFSADSYSPGVGERVLVRSQTTQTQNGVYDVTSVGSGSTNWVLTRSSDYDNSSSASDVHAGDFVFIQEGFTLGGTGWTETAIGTSGGSKHNIVIGTDDIVFTQFSGAGSYTAGTGLTLTGTVFSLANTAVTPGTYTKVTVNAQGQVTTGASIASGDVTTALGFTPYDATNPSGYISANQNITLSGDATGSGTTAITVTLANTAVTAASYGDATHVGTFTVDAKGRLTAASATAITFPVTTVAGRTGAITLAQADISGLTTASSPTFAAVSASTFTGALVGNADTATTASTVTTNANLTGDVTSVGNATTLAASGVSAGTYGQVTVDAKGRVTVGTVIADVAHGGTGVATLTGLVKASGTSAFAAATAGTDYSAGTSALTTGILKSTTSTGALTIAIAADFPTLNQNTSGNAATATALATSRSITATGDAAWTVNFDGTGNVSAALTLATVNSNTGSFGSTTAVPIINVNGKGLITSVSTATLGSIAVQNANAVAITGGTVDGTTVGATTASTGRFTTLNATTSMAINNQGFLTSNSTAVTTNTSTPIDTFASATYRSAKYQVQIADGTSYEMAEVSVVHDGTTVYVTTYGNVFTSAASLGSFDASITAGTLTLSYTAVSATSKTVKLVRTAIVV